MDYKVITNKLTSTIRQVEAKDICSKMLNTLVKYLKGSVHEVLAGAVKKINVIFNNWAH